MNLSREFAKNGRVRIPVRNGHIRPSGSRGSCFRRTCGGIGGAAARPTQSSTVNQASSPIVSMSLLLYAHALDDPAPGCMIPCGGKLRERALSIGSWERIFAGMYKNYERYTHSAPEVESILLDDARKIVNT